MASPSCGFQGPIGLPRVNAKNRNLLTEDWGRVWERREVLWNITSFYFTRKKKDKTN